MKGWKSMSTDYTSGFDCLQLNHNSLSVSPALIQILGSSGAVMFSLMQRYSHDHNGDWFPKSYKEWAAELGLSLAVVRRCIHGHANAPYKIPLTKFGVDVMRGQHNGAPTNFYRIDWERVSRFLYDYQELFNQMIEEEVRREWGEKYVDWLRDNQNND